MIEPVDSITGPACFKENQVSFTVNKMKPKTLVLSCDTQSTRHQGSRMRNGLDIS